MTPLTQEAFQEFIDFIPTHLEQLKSIVGKDTFHYSFEEVDAIESLYRKYRKKPRKISLTKNELDTLFVAYIGTAVLWHFGGYWLYVNDNESPELGTPYIADSRGMEGQEAPAFSPEHWRFFIDTKQAGERISEQFLRWKRYHDLSPEIILKPVRNIN